MDVPEVITSLSSSPHTLCEFPEELQAEALGPPTPAIQSRAKFAAPVCQPLQQEIPAGKEDQGCSALSFPAGLSLRTLTTQRPNFAPVLAPFPL